MSMTAYYLHGCTLDTGKLYSRMRLAWLVISNYINLYLYLDIYIYIYIYIYILNRNRNVNPKNINYFRFKINSICLIKCGTTGTSNDRPSPISNVREQESIIIKHLFPPEQCLIYYSLCHGRVLFLMSRVKLNAQNSLARYISICYVINNSLTPSHAHTCLKCGRAEMLHHLICRGGGDILYINNLCEHFVK